MEHKNVSCPSDPVKAKLCSKLRSFSWVILYISLTLYLVGFFFAFIAIHIFLNKKVLIILPLINPFIFSKYPVNCYSDDYQSSKKPLP